ncbi:hypothetical protein DNTS_011012, partial [Danionella cerebrum]
MKMMKTLGAFLLLFSLMVNVEGQNGSSRRCHCKGKGINMVLLKNIEKFEIIPPSPSCNKLEIVATLKNGTLKCLNPESKFSQFYILKDFEQKIQQSLPSSTTATVPRNITQTSTTGAAASSSRGHKN